MPPMTPMLHHPAGTTKSPSGPVPKTAALQLAGTRAGGFVLTRQEAAGKWGKATYSLARTSRA